MNVTHEIQRGAKPGEWYAVVLAGSDVIAELCHSYREACKRVTTIRHELESERGWGEDGTEDETIAEPTDLVPTHDLGGEG